jgi:hypothetical protein
MLFHLHDEDFDENLSQELVILLIRTFLGWYRTYFEEHPLKTTDPPHVQTAGGKLHVICKAGGRIAWFLV